MRWNVILAVLVMLAVATSVEGQWIRGAVGYDPEIGTVQDGIFLDVRPVISADRRYIQMTFNTGIAVVEEIDDFEVITGLVS